MTSRLILPGCVAVLVALLCAPTLQLVRAQGPDLGTDAQRESGKKLYLKVLLPVPRRDRRRRGLRHPASAPQAP